LASDARLRLRIDVDSTQAERGVSSLRTSLGGLSSALGKGLGAAAKIGIGALAALKAAVLGLGISYDANLEQSNVAWTTLLGNTQKAQDMLQRISSFAASTPFETADVDIMAKYMHNAGLEGQGLFDALMHISDVASAFAIPASDAKEMARQMSQVRQAGVAYTEDLNILQDRGVPIYKALADQLHTNVANVKKLASEGKISSDVYLAAFDNIAKGVQGASDAQSKTFTGMISTIKDNLDIMMGIAAQGPFQALKSGMEKLLPILQAVTSLMKGDNMGFITQISQAFSPSQAVMIIKFFEGIKTGIEDLKSALGIAKQVVLAFFKDLQGDGMGSIDILAKLGLSPSQIQLVLGIFDTIKAYLTNLIAYWSMAFQTIMTVVTTVWNFIAPYIQQALSTVVAYVQEKLAQIQAFWNQYGGQITQAVQNFWSIIQAIFSVAWPILVFIIKLVWDTITGVIDGAIKIIMGIIQIFTGLFTLNFSTMWDGIKNLFIGALQFVWNLINLIFLGEIFGSIKLFFKGMIEAVKLGWTAIKENWRAPLQWIMDFVGDIFSSIGELFNLMKSRGQSTFEAMWNLIKSLWQSGVNGVKSLVQGLSDTVGSIWNGIKSTASSVWEGIKSAITNPIESAKNTVIGIIDTIKSAFSSLILKIPKPKLPHVTVAMKSGIMGIQYPDFNVDWYAKGGIFDGASVIGVGEAGPEAVVPLSGQRMKPFADAIASLINKGSGSSGGDVLITGNTFHVRDDSDILRIARELKRLQDRKTR
jgi:tape measure domain-containing protein